MNPPTPTGSQRPMQPYPKGPVNNPWGLSKQKASIDPPTYTGQAEKPYSTRRKRRRSPKHGPRFPRCALYRPGRFFRINRRLEMIRLDMNPRHLGEADWMLYRRPFNPYRKRLRAHQAYNAGFRMARREDPKPNRPAISW